jgi:hypothetical protein
MCVKLFYAHCAYLTPNYITPSSNKNTYYYNKFVKNYTYKNGREI